MNICTAILTYDTPLYNFFDNIKIKYLNSKNEDYYLLYNGTDNTKENILNKSLNYYSDIHRLKI